ncbi:MAG TPA: hypothetical protein VFH51_19350, partial [Myxococcota bacterium]|nr:hypothetical protein [Myxococcota bacterium]
MPTLLPSVTDAVRPATTDATPADSTPAVPEGVKQTLLRGQRRFQIRRAHDEYGEARGFDMRQASNANFQQVRKNLRDGLSSPRVSSAPPVPEARPGDSLLTHLEAEAFTFILENLTLRHASRNFAACDGTLLSLKQRERT